MGKCERHGFCIFEISRYQTSASRIKFAWKGYFQSKTEKVNSTTEFRIFKLVLVQNFNLNWQFWFFGPNLPKEYLVKIGKKWTTYEFHIFQISRYQTSASRIKFASKGYSQSKTEKVNGTYRGVLHIQISLGTKFQLKLTIFIFWNKFPQKGYFQSKS